MKLCPINPGKCMGAACGWNIAWKERQACSVAVIAMQLLYDKSERYYPTDLILNEEENGR